MTNKIIQASYPGTGSTVLVNILHGLISPDKAVTICGSSTKSLAVDCQIIKTHIYKHTNKNARDGELGIDKWIKDFKDVHNLYFICSERDGRGTLNKKYHSYENVLRIPYKMLLETETHKVPDIVSSVSNKMKNFFPWNPNLDMESAIKRINRMNKLYEKIKDKPFSYYDKFYHIHGSHRDRSK